MICTLASVVEFSGGSISLVRIVFALILGSFLVFVAAIWLKRSGGQLPSLFSSDGDIEARTHISVVAVKRVRPGWDVVLLECGDEEHFVLMSQSQAVPLGSNKARTTRTLSGHQQHEELT